MGGSVLRMRAVAAYPTVVGSSGNTQCNRESEKPLLRNRTPNVSIALATTQVLNERNCSNCKGMSGSTFMKTPLPDLVRDHSEKKPERMPRLEYQILEANELGKGNRGRTVLQGNGDTDRRQ